MTATMPDTWPGFLEQVGAMFGGRTPKADAEAVVLGTWAANAVGVWNAALSVAAELAGGRVEHPWPALAGRCPPIAQAAARANRGPRFLNAPSGQAELPERETSAERRERILEQSGALELLERLHGPASYRPTLGRPPWALHEPDPAASPVDVDLTPEQLAGIEARRQATLTALRPPDPGPEPE